MARPTKAGLDYFELDCHMEEKVRLVQAEFGLKGFAIVVKLYQKIYGELGYYCEWNEDSSLLFMSENGVSSREEKNLICEVVAACIRRGIFSESMFNRYGVLTSVGVQERYLHAVSRREYVELKKEYLLFDVPENCKNVVINPINVNRNAVSACRNPQSRVEKSRVDQSREKEDSAEPEAASTPACPRASAAELLLNDGTAYAVSAEELAEWAGTYPAVDVAQEFREMAAWLKNNPAKRKTRRGIKRFIMNWLGSEQDKGSRPQAAQPQPPKKKNRFINYTQSEYDFAEIERMEREMRMRR